MHEEEKKMISIRNQFDGQHAIFIILFCPEIVRSTLDISLTGLKLSEGEPVKI